MPSGESSAVAHAGLLLCDEDDVCYASPELLNRLVASSAATTAETHSSGDIFAFGAVLYAMCTRTRPWDSPGHGGAAEDSAHDSAVASAVANPEKSGLDAAESLEAIANSNTAASASRSLSIAARVLRGERPVVSPGALARLAQAGLSVLPQSMNACWATRPADRPTAAQLLATFTDAIKRTGS